MDTMRIRKALSTQRQRHGAAVIIPLVEDACGLSVLLEVRASTLDVQPGEVCLPGGRIEDGEDPLDAAIRETCEELLVLPDQLEVLGSLGQLTGPGGQPLHVFVASLACYEGTFSPAEVSHTFLLSLDWLVDHEPAAFRVEYEPRFPTDFPWELVPGGQSYPWHARTHEVPFYTETDPVIWGVTARVLKLFADAVS